MLQGSFSSQKFAHCYRIKEMFKLFMARNEYLLNNVYVHAKGSSDLMMQILASNARDVELNMTGIKEGLGQFYARLDNPVDLHLEDVRRIDTMLEDALLQLDVSFTIPAIPALVGDLRKTAELKDYIKLFTNTGANAGRIENLSKSLTYDEAAALTHYERTVIIKNLLDGYTGNSEEQAIIKILNTVPASGVENMITYLTNNRNENLKLLHDNIHGDEQKAYYLALGNLMHKRYAVKGPDAFYADARKATVLPWNDPTILGSWWENPRQYTVNLEDDGKISIQHVKAFSLREAFLATPLAGPGYYSPGDPTIAKNFNSEDSGKLKFNPFDMVCVNFLSDEAHVNKVKGDNFFVPAVFLMDFQDKQDLQMLRQVGDLALFSVGMLFGAGEIAAASRIWKVIAIADMLVAAGDLIINQLRSQIMGLKGGPEFLKAWDIFNTAFMIFGIGQLLYNAPEIIRNLKGLLSRRLIDAVGDEARKLDEQLGALQKLADESQASPQLRSVLSELDEAKRAGLITSSEELDSWITKRVPEGQRQLFDQETRLILNGLDEVDVKVVRIQRNIDEVRFRICDPSVSNSRYAKIPKKYVDNGRAESIIEDIAGMDDVRRQRALDLIDTRYQQGEITMEDHHWITQNLVNKSQSNGYWFLNQKHCGIDLINDQRNLSMIAGHRGRHPFKASESFNNVLIEKLNDLRDDLKRGLITNAEIPDEVLRITNEMQTGVAKGEILLYNHEDFIILEYINGNGFIH